jgi:hypothetical protein
MDTLFGWPEAPQVSVLEMLGLLGGLPLLATLLVYAIAKADAVIKVSKHGPGPHTSDPIWMGGRARSIMGGGEDELSEGEAARRRQLTAAPSTPTSEADAGGASARW